MVDIRKNVFAHCASTNYYRKCGIQASKVSRRIFSERYRYSSLLCEWVNYLWKSFLVPFNLFQNIPQLLNARSQFQYYGKVLNAHRIWPKLACIEECWMVLKVLENILKTSSLLLNCCQYPFILFNTFKFFSSNLPPVYISLNIIALLLLLYLSSVLRVGLFWSL